MVDTDGMENMTPEQDEILTAVCYGIFAGAVLIFGVVLTILVCLGVIPPPH